MSKEVVLSEGVKIVEYTDKDGIPHQIIERADEETLKQGAKLDTGKPRLDLVPTSLEEAVGTILTMGAIKYAPHNWRKGINYSRIIASLKRHLNEFYKGQNIDAESGKPHLWHAACNIAFLIDYETNPEKYGKFDDRYKGEE